MRLVPISTVPDGAQLGRDIQTGRPDGIPLLRAGVRLTPRYRDALKRAGINALYIEDDLSAGIRPTPAVSDETRSVATRAVATAYRSARDAVTTGHEIGAETLESLSSIVDRILLEIESSGDAALALADLANADGYTFQHSVDVAALGLMIGRRMFDEHGWIDYRGVRRYTRMDERLTSLGLGLMLHDIGKLAIPFEILHKPGRLTPDEWEIMITHPRLGLELLQGEAWSPLVKGIVLRHHERWNGSGYPDGREGTAIHEMARIAAVADVFDAITSERVYAPARPACDGVRVILEGSGVGFDPDIVDVFSRIVAPFPEGVELTLSDGRRGIVASVPPQALDRPVVRVLSGPGAPCEVALLDDPELGIAGWDVGPAAAAA